MAGRFTRKPDRSGWRRIARIAWDKPNDPTCYGTLTVDASEALRYVERVRRGTGTRATMTHLAGRAVALALRETPEINGRIVKDAFEARTTVDICFQVVAEEGTELTVAKIERADEKGAHEIARELQEKAERIRSRQDPMFEKVRRLAGRLPVGVLRPAYRLAAYLANERGWDVRRLSLPDDPFGSAMVTSVGMFGIDVGYAPLFPLSATPLVVLVGEVQDKPVAVNGQVVVRPVLSLNVSFDHRFIDGFHAGRMSQTVRRYFADPASHETEPISPGA